MAQGTQAKVIVERVGKVFRWSIYDALDEIAGFNVEFETAAEALQDAANYIVKNKIWFEEMLT